MYIFFHISVGYYKMSEQKQGIVPEPKETDALTKKYDQTRSPHHRTTFKVILKALSFYFDEKQGILFGISTGLCGALTALLAKLLVETTSPFQICFARSVPVMLCSLLVNWDECFKISGLNLLLLSIASFSTALSWICASICFIYLRLGNACVIEFNTLVLTSSIFGCLFLKEKLNMIEMIALLINSLGSTCAILNPIVFHMSELDATEKFMLIIGASFAILAGIFAAIKVLLIRYCGRDIFVDPLLVTNFTGCFAVLLSTMFNTFMGIWTIPQSLWEWTFIVSVGIFSLLREICCFSTLNHLKAAHASILFTIMIVASFILQILVFGQVPELLSCCGAVLTITSVISVNLNSVNGEDRDNRS